MNDHQNENARWAQQNGYEFHAESEGVISEGARSLDIFRKADSYRDHVLGVHRNRPFEILDAWVETYEGSGLGGFGGYGFVWETIVVIPISGLKLPNFDLLPRRETGGMNFLGIKGLDLKANPIAPPDEQRLVDAFNKSYSLFAGGAFEAMEAAIKSAEHLVPSLADMTAICKPSVLLCEQPAIWAVPLAITLMIVVSKLTAKDVPADIRMKMLVLHAPEKLGLKQEYIQEHQPH